MLSLLYNGYSVTEQLYTLTHYNMHTYVLLYGQYGSILKEYMAI